MDLLLCHKGSSDVSILLSQALKVSDAFVDFAAATLDVIGFIFLWRAAGSSSSASLAGAISSAVPETSAVDFSALPLAPHFTCPSLFEKTRPSAGLL